jgi:uncharacterized integral membrane protein
MPFRLISLFAVMVISILFAGFNTEKVTISFGFYQFTDIPLFLALLSSFAAGMLVMFPFVFIAGFRNKKSLLNKAEKAAGKKAKGISKDSQNENF